MENGDNNGYKSGLFTFWSLRYLHDIYGIKITEVSIVISSWLILSSVGQIPAGIFADKYGHKLSMIIGTLIILIGTSVYAFAANFFFFIS